MYREIYSTLLAVEMRHLFPSFYFRKEANTGLTALRIHATFLTQILYVLKRNLGITWIKCMEIAFGKPWVGRNMCTEC